MTITQSKLFILVVLIFSTSLKLFAQVMLDITPVTQKDPLACWSASMEMIMLNKYPNDLQTQCEIVDYYDSKNCACPVDCTHPITNASTDCSQSVEEETIEELFEDPSYRLKKKVSLTKNLRWENVTDEIDNNKPFILGINYYASSNKCLSTHFVVVKGYESDASRVNFMKVTDPKDNCVGIGITSVRHKPPGTDMTAKHCRFIYNFKNEGGKDEGRAIPMNKLISFFACESAIKKPQKDLQIKQKVASGLYQKVPVNYYGFQNNKIDSSKRIIDMIYVEPCGGKNIVTRMQYINGLWETLMILEQNDAPAVPVTVLGKSYLLNNGKTLGIDENIKYEKVILPPSPYEFYRFSLDDGRKYYYTLAHVDNAYIKTKSIKKGEIFNTNEILDMIKSQPRQLLIPEQPSKKNIKNKTTN